MDQIPWCQFKRWIDFRNQYGPFGDERADQRAGVAAARMTVILAAAQGHKIKVKPSDFMLDYGPDSPVLAGKKGPTAEGWSNFKSALKNYGKSISSKNKSSRNRNHQHSQKETK